MIGIIGYVDNGGLKIPVGRIEKGFPGKTNRIVHSLCKVFAGQGKKGAWLLCGNCFTAGIF